MCKQFLLGIPKVLLTFCMCGNSSFSINLFHRDATLHTRDLVNLLYASVRSSKSLQVSKSFLGVVFFLWRILYLETFWFFFFFFFFGFVLFCMTSLYRGIFLKHLMTCAGLVQNKRKSSRTIRVGRSTLFKEVAQDFEICRCVCI